MLVVRTHTQTEHTFLTTLAIFRGAGMVCAAGVGVGGATVGLGPNTNPALCLLTLMDGFFVNRVGLGLRVDHQDRHAVH